ncbi:hypothetical protein IMZ48_29555 [Candidatus Bathyarchaeota archaeon]|nr:hypothetical protein [Candidatus Bathyarchaeota archaeon]
MALRTWLAVSAAAVLSLANPASAGPKVPRAEDAALSFIDDLVANLTEAAGEADGVQKHALSCAQKCSRKVNLGYAKYEGYHDEEADLNVWKG